MPGAAVRVTQLEQLLKVGAEALGYLQSGQKPSASWSEEQLRIIVDAEKPAGLVRFTFLPSLRKLVESVAK
jgi:hexosaminidase